MDSISHSNWSIIMLSFSIFVANHPDMSSFSFCTGSIFAANPKPSFEYAFVFVSLSTTLNLSICCTRWKNRSKCFSVLLQVKSIHPLWKISTKHSGGGGWFSNGLTYEHHTPSEQHLSSSYHKRSRNFYVKVSIGIIHLELMLPVWKAKVNLPQGECGFLIK